ncbi:hypothetical protein FHG66_21165 [Rubellimicrobium rubrum]|uniref:Uncharacterized protein n=1 Tax=Rubellimicrobium rubrum TaxID=2585369 RepID=A0A5C4MGG3_9RHOB|nr:hypothetical protein [Rubellimicrobium rubrum]TNC43146.1 hypothetical protein FHG66_21165 [Rubellimicrobium rubrum]
MSEPSCFCLTAAAREDLSSLKSFLHEHSGKTAEVLVEGDRPLTTSIVQLLLSAIGDAPEERLWLVTASPRVLAGLKLLGVHDFLTREG